MTSWMSVLQSTSACGLNISLRNTLVTNASMAIAKVSKSRNSFKERYKIGLPTVARGAFAGSMLVKLIP